eukprot:XP_011669778.1 PREDICTED: putative defense protein Hdd11-like [Strongylocentrotus purpuratus]
MTGNVMTLLSFMIGLFSFLVLCQVQSSNAYPTGAVTSACGDMTPNHGFSAQTSVSPYTITVSPVFYQPGEQMTVTISRNTGSPALKGILLQARRTGTDQIIGTWSLEGTTGFQTLVCNGANSAVTHTSNDDKPAAFQLNWTPPDVNGSDIYVTNNNGNNPRNNTRDNPSNHSTNNSRHLQLPITLHVAGCTVYGIKVAIPDVEERAAGQLTRSLNWNLKLRLRRLKKMHLLGGAQEERRAELCVLSLDG